MAKIYVIEDDASLCVELLRLLRREGYDALSCDDFARAAQGALAAEPDLVLLDLTLPATDGQLVCREIRAASEVPVIVLTSRVTETDEVVAMTLGADDFVAKPLRSRVLLARIEAVLRRSGTAPANAELAHGGLTLDLARSRAYTAEGSVELTKNEARILALLMRRSPAIVSRDELMRELWESDEFIDDNTLTVNVNRLRSTLGRIGARDLVVTRRGQGYSL